MHDALRDIHHPEDTPSTHDRVDALFRERYDRVARWTDRLFMWLLLGEWTIAVFVSVWLSPFAWAGKQSVVHSHVYSALFIGGLISSLPVILIRKNPGAESTRAVVACAQVMWSALLIHLTGGRIETHFHIFGSLAILAFYRDVKIMIPATLLVTIDHFVRGVWWPESVYGVLNPEWWRFLEHTGWVLFIDVFLILNCRQSYRELYEQAAQQVQLSDQRDQMGRMEKLAAVGQLAASVGHELRNPLAAIRNAHTYITRKLGAMEDTGVEFDPRVTKFLGLMERELDASAKIITNLLDFSRPRDPAMAPCPLRPLVAEAIEVVPKRKDVLLRNEVPDELPVPELDKGQFRQILINLIQNAVEAVPAGQPGQVTVAARGGDQSPWLLTVADDGSGIPQEVLDKIFQPLFSTKAKGTGLGLAVVAGMVKRHGGTLSVESAEGEGTTITVELPPVPRPTAP